MAFFIFLLAFFTPFCQSYFAFGEDTNALLNSAASNKEAIFYAKAIEAFEVKPELPLDTSATDFKARLHYLNGDSKKASEILENLRAKDWLSYLYLGLCYEDLGRFGPAVDNYLRSLKLNRNSIALYRLGKIYYQKRLYLKASRFFSQTIALDSSLRLANYYLADCFLKTGDFKKAYTYSARGINFYPQNKDIKEQLLAIKDKLGKAFFVEVKSAIENARELVKLMFYKREKDIPAIRVGIATGLKEFTFRCGGKFTMAGTGQYFKGEKDKFYSLVLKNGKLYLKDAKKGATYKKFKSPLTIKSNGYPFYILNITYGHGNFWHNEFDHIYRGDLKIISSKTISLINILSIEEYLYGVLPSEINASADPQALKAQAVAARTIALYSIKSSQRHRNEGFDVCADTHCQVYQGMSVEKSRTNKAVDETKGEIIVYRGEPIEAIYHSNCGGCLRPDVFYGKPYYALAFDSKKKFYQLSPYEEEMWFVSWPQSFCSHSQTSSYRWQRVYDSQDFSLAFGRDIKEIKAIRPKEKISGMAYKTLELIDKSGSHDIKGDFNIRNYFDKLRSSSFKVDIKFSNIPAAKNAKEVKKETRMIFFWGAGFGHGVGMCQDGTEYMAKDGYTYHEILSHYYPHTATIRQY